MGVVTHEGPGGRNAKARAPGRACPGKGEDEAGGSRRKQAVRQLGSLVRALGLCRGSEVCCDHFGVAQQRDPAVSRGRVPCFPTFSLLAHIIPAGSHFPCCGAGSALCWMAELCVWEAGDAQPFPISWQDRVCPALPTTQLRRKNSGSSSPSLHPLVSPLCSLCPTMSSPAQPL